MSGNRGAKAAQSAQALTSFAAESKELDALCRRNGIRSLRLFGSVLTGEATADSDIDLLVEFNSGLHVSLLDLVRIEQELSMLLKRPIDLRTGPELSRHFRTQVLSEARTLYG